MANNLIKNETEVFYTVEVNENLVVAKVELYHGKIESAVVRRKKEQPNGRTFTNDETAQKVAIYVGGKVIQHTRTEVITEVTEEAVFIHKEEINND